MDIVIYHTIDMTKQLINDELLEKIRQCNGQLQPHEHAPDCPVRAGASVDCVWPHAVCFATRFVDVYNIDHTPSTRSPSDAPPAPPPSMLQRWQWVGSCGTAENIPDGHTVMVGVGKPCVCGDKRCIAQAVPLPGDIR